MGQTAKRSDDVRPPRQQGNPRPMWAFRAPEQIVAWAKKQGGERSDMIVTRLLMAIDLEAELGSDLLLDLEYRAKKEGLSIGAFAGKLLRDALKKR